jgi:hypothetical protein
MNTNLIKNAIEAFKNFVAAVGNDVCNDAAENKEYVVFAGSVTADNEGNVKTYSPSGELVAQVPLRPVLNNLADFAKSMVDLYAADKEEREARRAEEEAAEAEADEAANEEIDSKISDLESQISSLKLRKKHVVRHYVKRF